MTSTPSPAAALYAELNKSIHISDYRSALKAANKLLHIKESKNDFEAMCCKVVCLIELGNFADGLKFVNSLNLEENELAFEKAYCQYRLLQSKDALVTINEVENPDLRLLELKSQVLYKLGMYKEALVVYKKLIKECSDDFEEERRTNLSAVQAALSIVHDDKAEIGFEPETHEQLYNKSCWLLGQKQFSEAEKTLHLAESVCSSVFEDDADMTDEEKEAELSMIRVQIAYAMQCQGRDEEAMQFYSQAIRSRPSDTALIAVASNNIICINKDQNVFDSRKKVRALTASGVENKLVQYQKEKMDYNRALLLMHTNQWEACRKLLSQLHREYNTEMSSMIQAALLCREKNATVAIEYLQELIERYSDPDLPAKFDLTNIKVTLVQLLLSQGELDKGCAILESIESLCYKPAIVSCLVSLYEVRGKSLRDITAYVEEAIKYNSEQKTKSGGATMASLLWGNSQFYMKKGFPEEAAVALEHLLRHEPNNIKARAQLVSLYSSYDVKKSQRLCKSLPSYDKERSRVDVDELEKRVIGLAPRYIKKQKILKEQKPDSASVDVKRGVVSEASANSEIIKKKKKKKKNPAPKDFQPGFVPDSERWLPLRERSYYRGRKRDKRRAGAIGKGTQGSANVGSGESADLFNKSGSTTSHLKSGSGNNPKSTSGSTTPNSTPVNSPKPNSQRSGPKGKVQRKRRKGKY